MSTMVRTGLFPLQNGGFRAPTPHREPVTTSYEPSAAPRRLQRSGVVASLFSYVTQAGVRDEIDFEILTNGGQARLLTNVFNSEPFTSAGAPQFVPGPAFTSFTPLEIRWLPDRIEWRIDGGLVRQISAPIPDEAMTVRLNFWVPDSSFSEAFDAALLPVESESTNERFRYEVDYVEVSSVGS